MKIDGYFLGGIVDGMKGGSKMAQIVARLNRDHHATRVMPMKPYRIKYPDSQPSGDKENNANSTSSQGVLIRPPDDPTGLDSPDAGQGVTNSADRGDVADWRSAELNDYTSAWTDTQDSEGMVGGGAGSFDGAPSVEVPIAVWE